MNTKHDILAFLNKEGIFVQAQQLKGMEATQTWDLFVEYFEGLGDSQKLDCAGNLVNGMLARDPDLTRYRKAFGPLIVLLTSLEFKAAFLPYMEAIRTEFNDQQLNLEWAHSSDKPDSVNVAIPANWRYGLWLATILRNLGCRDIDAAVRQLAGIAASKQFKFSLLELLDDTR